MGGRGRSLTQRKHFVRAEKMFGSEADLILNQTTKTLNNPNPHHNWEPFATQNPSFDEYYKVIRL